MKALKTGKIDTFNQELMLRIMSDEDREIYQIYLQINFPAGSEEDFYVWKLGSKEHCPSCLANSNKIKRLKDW